jgi:hypothetical protein
MELRKFIKTTIREYLNEQNEILLAPNGNKSNLPKNLYEYVRANEFKKWFGDWENNPNSSSKVVDENGEPLLCNHSSLEKNIDVFYGGRIFRTKKSEVKPIWFSYEKNHTYADDDGVFQHKCFLNVKKMFEYSKTPDVSKLKSFYEKQNGKELPDYDFDMDWEAQERFNLAAYIYELGYDGYKFTDEYSIAVFNSNQIKCVG